MSKFTSRMTKAYNVLRGVTNVDTTSSELHGSSTNYYAFRDTTAKVMAPIVARIGMDVAAVNVRHVRRDENDIYSSTIHSGLHGCLTHRANVDQTGRAFLQDAVESLLGEGVIAIVPVDVDIDPTKTDRYKIESLRVAQIVDWYPYHVKLKVYNERIGKYVTTTLAKEFVAIVYNPFATVMNAPNSTLKRLVEKLALLDMADTDNGTGKLNLIMQLPFVIKTQKRIAEANARIASLESQLNNSKYGVAYAGATEKITQINRVLENNLFTQVEYLTRMLYSQLGLTPSVFDGTATGDVLINYYNRSVFPVLTAVLESMTRAFLTKTARAQGQSIEFYPELFKMAPLNTIAEAADALSRNEIVSANDMRGWLGLQPSDQDGANDLRNANLYPDRQRPNIEEA